MEWDGCRRAEGVGWWMGGVRSGVDVASDEVVRLRVGDSLSRSSAFFFVPFSNLDDDSVLNPTFLDVNLTCVGSKTADSKTTVLVDSFISEFSPPITPARAIAFSSSDITRSSVSSFLSISSRVVIVSNAFALLTVILPPLM